MVQKTGCWNQKRNEERNPLWSCRAKRQSQQLVVSACRTNDLDRPLRSGDRAVARYRPGEKLLVASSLSLPLPLSPSLSPLSLSLPPSLSLSLSLSFFLSLCLSLSPPLSLSSELEYRGCKSKGPRLLRTQSFKILSIKPRVGQNTAFMLCILPGIQAFRFLLRQFIHVIFWAQFSPF